MKPTREEVVKVSVTPKLLRMIAEDIDNRMKNAKIGDHVPGHAFYGDGFTVMLVADQDAWHAHTGGTWE